MRSIFTTWISRGALLQGAAASICLAWAAGCGGAVETGEGGGGGADPGLVCEPGSHIETVCDPTTGNEGDCHDECVADGDCPPGLVPSVVCSDPTQVDPTDGCAGGDPGQGGNGLRCVPPDEPDCEVVCLPPNPCEPGFHEETVCAEPGPVPMDHDGQPSTCVDPGLCWTECVPDDPCGPGWHEEWFCDPSSDADPVDDVVECYVDDVVECYASCVPDDPCGPGWHEEWFCDPSSDADPVGNDDYCYATCVPDNPCEPGSHEEWVCQPLDGDGDDVVDCFPTCVPDGAGCPLDQHLEWLCNEFDFCELVCVDNNAVPDEPPVDD